MKDGGARTEIEIKLRIGGAEEGRRRLEGAGFRVSRPRVFERNSILDNAEQRLQKSGSLLRIRQAGEEGLLTYKGPAQGGKHKTREEVETGVADAETLEKIFLRLGFDIAFRYEKYRTEYAAPGAGGLATLDETPIGNFLELEGDPEWIDEIARRLGFAASDYVTASYAALYREHRAAHPGDPQNMVFPSGPEK
jgi:adenylate cyclase class 2